MKKLLNDLFLPFCIVAGLILIMCTAYVADGIKTGVNQGSTMPVFAQNNVADELVLVIDPGHGGADGGAVSVTGNIESTINLDIALKLNNIAAFFGIKTILTRNSEEINYPAEADTIRKMKVYDQRSRVDLINNIDNAVVISIHQNNFSGSSAHGAQVFFRNSAESEYLACELQSLLTENMTGTSNRSAEQISDDIYLFKNISCTAVMVECGFLSNPAEDALLNTDVYRTKLAMTIASGYLTCEDELTKACFGGKNENKNCVLLY